jgi:hypothetical protein
MHVHSVKAPTLTELVDKLQEAADVIRRGLKQGGAHVVDPAILATYPTMNPNVVKAIDNGRVDLTPQEADEIYGDNSVDDVDNDPEPTPVVINAASIAQSLSDQSLAKDFVNAQRDARGMPYDDRIHASSKTTNKDGSWRYRRGVSDDVIAQVEAQLRGAPSGLQQVAPVVVPVANPVPSFEPAPVTQPTVQQVAPPVFPSAQPAFSSPPQQPVATAQPSYQNIAIPQTTKPTHSIDTFKAQFVPTLAKLVMSGQLTQDYVQQLKTYFKVNEIFDLKTNDAAMTEMFNTFVQAGLITGV